METAVLDACVLFRGGVRDFLLWVAEAGAFTPVWSDLIHDEWMRNRHRVFGDPIVQLQHTRQTMETFFPGANFPPDLGTLQRIANDASLPPGVRKDAHVVASGVAASATVIVTYNLVDFPDAVINPLGLIKMEPDDFCDRIFQQNPQEVIDGARNHRRSLRRPAYAPPDYLVHVGTALDLPRIANLLGPHAQALA